MRQYDPRLKDVARSLRANQTEAEQRLWARLRRRQILGIQFYRQRPVGAYIVDFLAPAAKLVVEVDGGQHFERNQLWYDQQRTRVLERQGLRVLRFTNLDVMLRLDAMLQVIHEAVEAARSENPP